MDFLKEYEILRTQGFPIRETIEFSYEPGKCGDVRGKRMRLRDSDVEDRNEEAIAKAKKRAVSLLQRRRPVNPNKPKLRRDKVPPQFLYRIKTPPHAFACGGVSFILILQFRRYSFSAVILPSGDISKTVPPFPP